MSISIKITRNDKIDFVSTQAYHYFYGIITYARNAIKIIKLLFYSLANDIHEVGKTKVVNNTILL